MDGCRRLSSDFSGLTREDSPPGFAPQDVLGTESASAEWTDEKHSLYLKSMETSFVNQLYNSMNLLGWCSQQGMSNPEATQHLDACTPSGEFKVLRDGCWEKMNFHKSGAQGPQPSTSTETLGHLKSPWFQHFRSSRKSRVVTSPGAQQVSSPPEVEYGKISPKIGAASSTKHPHSSQTNWRHHHHRHLVDDNAEVSDQNFVAEENEGENATNSCSSKRMKTTPEAPSNDQVVPYGKLPLAEE